MLLSAAVGEELFAAYAEKFGNEIVAKAQEWSNALLKELATQNGNKLLVIDLIYARSYSRYRQSDLEKMMIILGNCSEHSRVFRAWTYCRMNSFIDGDKVVKHYPTRVSSRYDDMS